MDKSTIVAGGALVVVLIGGALLTYRSMQRRNERLAEAMRATPLAPHPFYAADGKTILLWHRPAENVIVITAAGQARGIHCVKE